MQTRAGGTTRTGRWPGWLSWLVCLVFASAGCGVVSSASPQTTMTLTASSLTGEPVSDLDLDKAADMLLARLKAAGMQASVELRPGRTVVVTVVGSHSRDALVPLAGRGEIRFRPVLAVTADEAAGDPNPAGTTAAGGAGTSARSERTGGSGAGSPTLDSVRDSLGPAYRVAESLTDPTTVSAGQRAEVAPFAALSGAEVAVLPAAMQFTVPAVSCRQLAARPAQAMNVPDRGVVACDKDRKYLLGAAGLTGADIAGASVERDAPDQDLRVVVTFTSTGQQRWTAMTREAATAGSRDGKVRQVAIVVDGVVVNSQDIRGVVMGGATLTGLPPRGAGRTAALLRHGPLPLFFRVTGFTAG